MKLFVIETDVDTGFDRIVEVDPENVGIVIGINVRPWFSRWNVEERPAATHFWVKLGGSERDPEDEPTLAEAEYIVARRVL